MHLVIISGASRPQAKSNTAKIIEAFKKGYEENGNTTEVWYLSSKDQWDGAKNAFYRSNNILIALPLYVENIPGILLEFLEGLTPKKEEGTRIAFLIQGGFPEASQSRCCEQYLEMLPNKLGCSYGGTLIKGDMFGLGLISEEKKEKQLFPFIEMGRYFAKTHYFEKEIVNKFAAPEYLPKKELKMFKIFGHMVQKIFMGKMAKKLGCQDKLDAKPYQKDKSSKKK